MSVGRLQYVVRILVALTVGLLSVPLFSLSSAYADDGDSGQTEPASETTTDPAPEEPPAVAPPPPPEEPPAEEPAVLEPETPPAEEPVTEDPAVEEPPTPAAEEQEAAASSADQEPRKKASAAKVTTTLAPTAGGNCAASFSQNTQENHGGAWINGALNPNNSNYAEGDYVPQRVELTGLAPGVHTLTFSYDRTKNGLYAYDFVDHLTITGSAGATAVWDAEAPNAPMPFAETVFVTITFTIIANDPTATITWEGHIASELDYGPDSGAGTINGAPYHFSLVDMSCGNVGQQDNQLMAAAVDAGQLTVVKDAQPNDPQDFHFTIDAPNDLNAAFDLDDDGDGTLPSSVTYNVPPGASTVTEVDIAAGWTLTDITCTEAGVEVGSGVTVTLSDDEHITCTFTNSRESSLEVDKYWVINGAPPVQEGSEPAHLGLGAQLTVNGQNQPWNTSLDGFLQGAGVSLDEVVTIGNDLCTLVSKRATEDNGATIDAALPYADQLGGGANHYTITNTVTCDAELTLVKDVLNGPAPASAWTLSADGPDGSLAFASGSTGVSHPVTAGTPYALSEDDADPRYVQAGPWTCGDFSEVTTMNGVQSVAVEAGRSTTCTVQNATGELVLVKDVQNTNGGTAVEADFTLTATGDNGTVHANPGSGAGTTLYVDPEESFALSESSLEGYNLASLTCSDGQDPASVEVAADTTVTCTFVNVDTPGSLRLIKDPDEGDTGAPAADPTAWHLTASQNGSIVFEGDGDVTQGVPAGDYEIAESGGLPGYEFAGWSCVGGELAEENGVYTVTVPFSADVVCTVTNDAVAPTLTLEKLVDTNDSGDEAVDTDWTLTADSGSDSITGVEGDAAITDAEVEIGTYVLTESGPATYELVGWTCEGASVEKVGDTWSVTVGLGDAVTCEAENRAIISDWMVTKSADVPSGATVEPGDEIHYTVTVTRIGNGVNVEDIDVLDVIDGIDDLSWISDVVASNGTAIPADGPPGDAVIGWHIDELSDTVTLTYTLTIGEGAWNRTIHNVVTPGTVPCPDPDPTDPLEECDETTHFTPHFLLNKSVELGDEDGDGEAEPGETLTFTLSMENDSDALLEDAVVIDDVSDLFDHGTITSTEAELAAQGLVLDGTPDAETLTWTVASLAAGASTSASYEYLIGAGQHDVVIENVATPEEGGPGECEIDCDTDTPTPPVTTMVVEKQNFETQEVLAGATFELWKDMDNAGADPDSGDCTFTDPPAVSDADVLLGTEVTDGAGLALFHELEHGCYFLVETAPPPNYELPENNVMAIAINEENFVPGGEMAPIVITDFAEGQLAILAKRQFEFIDGTWVESDGEVEFGDVVKYKIRIGATGPKVFHDVRVTDYVPGFNPEDTESTVEGTLVPGSAVCSEGPLVCTGTLDPATQLVTWEIGTVAPGPDETITGTAEMIVEFPQLPDGLDLDPGETFTAWMWNVGYVSWDEVVGGTPPQEPEVERSTGAGRAAGKLGTVAADFVFETHTLRSNEVLVEASFTEDLVIDPPPPNPPNPPLPNTGAQAYLGQLAGLGGLVLALGLALIARGRRKEMQEA